MLLPGSMEVIDLSDQGRDALIDSILGTKTKWGGGGGVGVYGADVCALCGTVDNYRGWIMAAYGCHFGPQNEFICSACRHRLIPQGMNGLTEQKQRVGRALKESRVRYCQLCESKMRRDPRWGQEGSGRFPRICDGCRSRLQDRDVAEEDEIIEVVKAHVRRRYLERLPSDELTDMADTVDAMRQELDAMEEEAKRLGGD